MIKMDDSESEFVDNIFERISSGVQFDTEELDTLLENVNSKLEDVTNRLQHGRNELQNELQHVENGTQLKTCHSESLSLQCFLNNVVQAMERNPGSEDYILTDLTEFCFRNSIILPPLHEDGSGVAYSETDSLNSIIEKTEEENQLLWIKICNKLKIGFLNLMKDLPILNSKKLHKQSSLPSYSKFVEERQSNLCKQLLCIFPQDTVIDMVCKLRQMQLEYKGSSPKEYSVTFADETSACIHRSIKTLGKVVSVQVCMMHNDVLLFQSIPLDEGLLSDAMQKLFKIYLENLAYHVEVFKDCYNRIHTTTVNVESTKDSSKENMFTTSDLRNFSKVFYILHSWSTNACNIINHLNTKNQVKETIDSISLTASLEMLISECSFKHKHEVWNWKKMFVSYIPVFKKVIPSYIHCVCNIVIESRKSEKCTQTAKMVHVNEKLLEGKSDCPVQVSTHCGTLLSLLNEMILFAIPDEENLFKDLYTAATTGLIDGLNIHGTYCEEILKTFQETQSNIDEMYPLLSDLSLMVIQLNVWDSIISKEQRNSVLQMVIANAQATLSACVAAIIKYHIDVLKSSLVFDYHGNNWEDDKPFFEGERCSFTVQMWSYYMQSVVYDVKTILPEQFMKQILWGIGMEMLIFFTSRYSAVKPSYRRQKQFKADVLVLLSSFKWLLLHVIDNLQEITDMDNEKTDLWHTLCTQLFDTMIVTSSPLEDVCCYLENMNNFQQIDCKKNMLWYAQVGTDRLSEFPSSLILDIIVKQKNVDWNLMVQLLTFNNSQLSIALLRNAAHLKQYTMAGQNSVDTNMNAMFCSRMNIALEPLDEERLVSDLVSLFLRLPKKSFVRFMALSLIKDDHSKSFKVQNDQLPLWLRVISRKLNPVLARILNHALDLLLAESKHKASPSFAFTKLQKLPCGCPTVNQTEEEKYLSGTQLLHKCLMVTLEALVDSIPLLPSRIWDLLVYVKGQPTFTQSWIKQENLGTKVLACLLYNWLVTNSNLQHKSHGTSFSAEAFDNIFSFAELLWHVVYHLTYDVTDNPNISMAVHKDLQSTGPLITKRLARLHDYFDRTSLLYDVDTTVNDELSNVFISPVITPCNEEEMSSLKFIHSILRVNQVTIKEFIQCKEDFQTRLEENLKLSRHLNMEDFNPFHTFQHIGDQQINHFELLEGELKWNELMPLVAFPKWKVLIKNRFEFQENMESFLRDNEKEAVSKISIKLKISEDE